MASIQKRPDGSWRARYRGPDGRERSKHFPRKTEAQRWLDQVTTQVTTGAWTDPTMSRVTFGAWAEQWFAAQVHLSPATLVRYESLLRRQVLPTWERVKLVDIKHAAVAAWVQALVSTNLSASTVRSAHRVFSLALGLAVRDDRLPKNPADGVSLPRLPEPGKKYLTHDQVHQLADAAGELHGRDSDRLAILVLAYCGLRWGEFAGLRVGRLDTMRRRLQITEAVSEIQGKLTWGPTKTHASRAVPVLRQHIDDLVTLAAGRTPADILFPSPEGGVLRLSNFRDRVFDPAAKAVGLLGLTPHELRHTAASLAVSSGANVKAVQRLLGHKSAVVTLDVYSDLFDDDLDGVADRLDEAASRARADYARTTGPVSKLG